MYEIVSLTFWSKSIEFEFVILDESIVTMLERISFLSNSPLEVKELGQLKKLKLKINSGKQLKQLIPILKEKFSDSRYMGKEHTELLEGFFKEDK